jgi:hypothetical protein
MVNTMVDNMHEPLAKEISKGIAISSTELAKSLPEALRDILVDALSNDPTNVASNNQPSPFNNNKQTTKIQRRQQGRSMPDAFPTGPVNNKPATSNWWFPSFWPRFGSSSGPAQSSPVATNNNNNPSNSQVATPFSPIVLAKKVLSLLATTIYNIVKPIAIKFIRALNEFIVKHASYGIIERLRERLQYKSSSNIPPAVAVANLNQSKDANALNAVDAEMNGQASTATTTAKSTNMSFIPSLWPPRRRTRRSLTPLSFFSSKTNGGNNANPPQNAAKMSKWRRITKDVATRSLNKICSWLESDINAIVVYSIRSGMEDIFESVYNSMITAFRRITTCISLPEMPLVRKLANQAMQTGTTIIMWPSQKIAEWRRNYFGPAVNPTLVQSVQQEVAKSPDTCNNIGMQLTQKREMIGKRIYASVEPYTLSIIKIVQGITRRNTCEAIAAQLHNILPIFPLNNPLA